jgi:succinyl-diaminopimelate desuccinylase
LKDDLIIQEIENHRQEYVEFLRELIQIKSYNPPGNEKNVAIKLKEYFDKYGIHCEIFPFGDNRANLIAHLNDNLDGKCLLYNGHMDVVPPGSEEDWKYPPLAAHIKRNKYIYGRGTADMKSGLAAMVISLQILKKLNIKTKKNIILCAVADEETSGKLGALWTIENILKPRNIKCEFTVVGEATELTPLPKAIILGEKGHVRLKLITHGKSAHSSIPFEGKNAIYMISDIIYNFNKIDDYLEHISPPIPPERLEDLISEVFPNKQIFERIYSEQKLLQNFLKSLTTLTKSVNIIKGGIKDNIIPDKCEAIMDFRTLPGQNAAILKDALENLIKDLGYKIKRELRKKSEKICVEVEVIGDSKASYWEDWENSENLKALKEIAEKVYGRNSFYTLYPAASDARTIRNTKFCPNTVLFGPGNASLAHTVDEYIEIEDYINILKVYTLFANKYLSKE